jgi:pimeloyl-ACP methyl ester carboxylesterase
VQTLGRFRYLEALPKNGGSSPGRSRGARGEPLGTLVLIHGFPLSARMWEPQLELASLGWRIIAPQLRGFDGPPATPAATSMDDYAGDVIDFLDALHIETAVIGGLSMGGYITFALFRHAARYFRGMLLADTRAQADTPEGVEARKRMIRLVQEKGAGAAAEEMLPKLLGDTTRGTRPQVVEEVRRLILSNSPQTIEGALMALMTRPDSTPTLSAIHCPTLVLVGDEDSLTPPVLSEDIQRGIPQAELAVIPGAGHMTNLEQPAAFNLAVARFLEYRV